MWLLSLTGIITRASGRSPTMAFHHSANFISKRLSPCISTSPTKHCHSLFFSSSPNHGENRKTKSSSYDIDIDEEAEQRLTSSTDKTINGESDTHMSSFRYTNLIQEVGLDSMLTSTILKDMPRKRPVSPNDIFCNRELKLSAIDAIGFDMDYTLAQYQQPAFDNLAFEGAKRKLVDLLGYPKEVLDLQYDHNVCF